MRSAKKFPDQSQVSLFVELDPTWSDHEGQAEFAGRRDSSLINKDQITC